jgi:N-acetylglucosaminyl-diphospho-decaprenol L-rhamnosyltransferase
VSNSTGQVTVSIIILSWNTCSLMRECLASIVEYGAGYELEIIVIDNGSTDGTQAMIQKEFPDVQLVQNLENVGFARGNNQGVALSRGHYLLLLNSDAMLKAGSLDALVTLTKTQPRLGMAGARLINPDGSFQASHTPFPNQWREFLILSGLGRIFMGRWFPSRGPEEQKGPQLVDYVEGACMFFKREAYLDVKGLEESFFMYAEDVDLCYRLKQIGWQVWYHPNAEIIHYGGASSAGRRTRREGDLYRSRVQFFQKHYGSFQASLLKFQIYFFTFIKNIFHKLLRLVSGGKKGRPVIAIKDLATLLKN